MRRSRANAWLLLLAVASCAPAPRPHRYGDRRGPGGAPERLFISPMGEPFRGGGDGASPVRRWFDGADSDHDGRVLPAEFAADAERFFATLDTDGDGEIDPDEIDVYEKTVAPEIASRGMDRGAPGTGEGGMGRRGGRGHGGMGGGPGGGISGGGRGGGMGGGPEGGRGDTQPAAEQRQGAGRFSFLAFPEPVTSADLNFDRGVSRAEFARTAGQRFLLLDSAHRGYLTFDTLPPLPGRGGEPRRQRRLPPGGG